MNTASIVLSSVSFAATIGKNGKVSTSSEKTAHALNSLSTKAVLGVALTGKGAMQKQAAQAVSGHAVTLGNLLALSRLDGGQWGDLLPLLVAEFGVSDYNRATQKGRAGCILFLETVAARKNLSFANAETVKTQETAKKALSSVLDVLAIVQGLNHVKEVENLAAREAEALRLAGLTEGATEGQTEGATEGQVA